MLPYLLLMFAATFFSAISQVLLKQSAGRTYKSVIYEYLNWRVIVAYGISFSVLLLNTYAYTVVPMKYGAVIDTFTYVFVMGLSYLCLLYTSILVIILFIAVLSSHISLRNTFYAL